MSKKNKHRPKQNPATPVAHASGSPPTLAALNSPTPPTTPVAHAPGSSESTQYEFTDAQNRVVDNLVQAIMWVRVPMIVTGVFQAVIATGLMFRLQKDGAHIVGILGHGLAAIVCFILASWLARAANAFMLITTTKGRDISHLMTALRNLDKWFDMLGLFVKLYLCLLGAVIIILMVGLLAGAFKEPS